jgi:CspA family cold shock protein
VWHGGRGFGFLKRDEGGPDVFCHFRDLMLSGGREWLEPGERVSFDLEYGKDGKLRGVRVTLDEGAET